MQPIALLLALAYALAAFFCFRLAGIERKHSIRFQVLLVAVALILLVLGFQKATGLLDIVTEEGRHIAKAEYWYTQRRAIQGMAIATILPCCAVFGVGALLLVRKAWWRYLPLLVALCYLLGFGMIQAISLHQIDHLLRERVAGIRLVNWGDALGLFLTALALFWLTETGSQRTNLHSHTSS